MLVILPVFIMLDVDHRIRREDNICLIESDMHIDYSSSTRDKVTTSYTVNIETNYTQIDFDNNKILLPTHHFCSLFMLKRSQSSLMDGDSFLL